RPAQAHTVGSPATAVASHRVPRAVVVEVRQAGRIVRGIDVLPRSSGCGSHAVDAPGNPSIEIVIVAEAADAHGSVVVGAHGKRLALYQRRDFVFAQNRDVALQDIHAPAVIEVVDAK